MSYVPFTRRLLAAALLAAAPARLLAAATTPGNATATLLVPLTVLKTADLDFGSVAVATPGTAVVDPVTNTMSTTGGVVRLGGTPHAARFSGAASKNSVVNIKIPNQPVTLTRVGGSETIVLSNFTLDGPSKRAMAQATNFEFLVGGTVTIAANQVQGSYRGTFDVTVQYP